MIARPRVVDEARERIDRSIQLRVPAYSIMIMIMIMLVLVVVDIARLGSAATVPALLAENLWTREASTLNAVV